MADYLSHENYQKRAELFWQKEVTALYEAEAGLSSSLSLTSVYAQYADLFTLQTVRNLVNLVRSGVVSPYLADFAVTRFLQNGIAELDESLFSHLAQTTVRWQGQSIPFFASQGALANEKDREKRRTLHASVTAVIGRTNVLRMNRWKQVYELACSTGFANYYTLYDELRQLNLAQLRKLAQEILSETAEIYFQSLSAWSEQLIGTEKPHPADIPYLLRVAQFDGLFQYHDLQAILTTSTESMGINLADYPGLEIDLTDRPTKSPRPFCAFVRVPDQIKLVARPIGGASDFTAVFHELGHALHGLHTNPSLPFVARYVGDDSVGEAFAFLFENLTINPHWLTVYLGTHTYENYAEFARFKRLLFIRRYAAKLLYECQLHSGLLDYPAETYAKILSEHLGIDIRPEFYLFDLDDAFYTAQYLRGWLLEAQLRQKLEEQFGMHWFLSPHAGTFLQELWQFGQHLNADKLAIFLGYPGLETQPLIADFQQQYHLA